MPGRFLAVALITGALSFAATAAHAQESAKKPPLSRPPQVEEEARFEAAVREMQDAYSRCYKAGMLQPRETFDRRDALAKCMNAAEKVRLVRLQGEALTNKASLAGLLREIPMHERKAYGAVGALLRTSTPIPERARFPPYLDLGPPPDQDEDSIPDAQDACPTRWGIPNPDPNKHGCPMPISVPMWTDLELELRQPVPFGAAKATIKPASNDLLDDIAWLLTRHPEILRVEVQGHTDNKEHAQNRKLSHARAEAVMTALVARGVSPDRLSAKGYGSDKPLRENTTEANRSVNRRVQLVIWEQRRTDRTNAAPAPGRDGGDLGPEFAPSPDTPTR